MDTTLFWGNAGHFCGRAAVRVSQGESGDASPDSLGKVRVSQGGESGDASPDSLRSWIKLV